MQVLKKIWKRNDGSTLVGAVAITAVLAIASAGLIGISRNTVSQEVDSHNDARAYLAAEAGLMVGVDWFRQSAAAVGSEFNFLHDGIRVFVDLVVVDANGSAPAGWAFLRSRAAHPDLSYDKILRWQVQADLTQEGTGVSYVDGGLVGTGQRRIDGSTRIDGPLHLNNPMNFHHQNNGHITGNHAPRFLGPVTVYNPAPADGGINLNYGSTPRASFTAGLRISNDAPQNLANPLINNVFLNPVLTPYALADKQIRAIYVPQPPITVPLEAIYNNNNPRLWFGKDSGQDVSTNIFNPDVASFGPANGARQSIPLNNGEMIIESDFAITIGPGMMNGVVSVITTGTGAAGDINFNFNGSTPTAPNSGSLTYAAVRNAIVPHTGGGGWPGGGNEAWIPSIYISDEIAPVSITVPNADLLATIDNDMLNIRNLVIGQDALLAFFANRNINVIHPNNGQNQARVITAQLFAPNGTVDFLDPNSNSNFAFRVVGSAAMRDWWVTGNASNNSGLSFFTIRDPRTDPRAPGIDIVGVGATPGGGEVVRSRWREFNRPGIRPVPPV